MWLYSNGSPIDDRRGTGFADSSGREYTIVLQRTAQTVRAMKDGYVPNDVSIFASSNSSHDVRDRRHHQENQSLHAALADVDQGLASWLACKDAPELDDGSSSVTGCPCFSLVSSDSSVVAVDGTGSSGMIRGVAPGSATITGTYYGVRTTSASGTRQSLKSQTDAKGRVRTPPTTP